MKKKLIFLLFVASFGALRAMAQGVDPQAYYTDSVGVEQVTRSISDGMAPLAVTFRSNPTGMDDYAPSYEWHFRKQDDDGTTRELFVRYEEDTQYTFSESGTFHIIQKTRLEQDGAELDSVTITVAIAQSRLEFPNAFSPNGDDRNEVYRAKPGWKSIVKFRAIILNRWGQKLFEWTDPAQGWDGKHNGNPVKEGVYFVSVEARGADGREYHIRKDVNLLRGYREGGTSSGSNE